MGVSLPMPIINKIRKHIANDDRYQNVPQFVKIAVEEKINRETIQGFSKGKRSFVDPYADVIADKMAEDVFDKVMKKLNEKETKKSGKKP